MDDQVDMASSFESPKEWLVSVGVPRRSHEDRTWRSSTGYSALHIACMHGNRDACEYLLRIGHSLEVEMKRLVNQTPFMMAIAHEQLDLCKWLLEKSESNSSLQTPLLTATNSIGVTPLMFACTCDSPKMTKWFMGISPPGELYKRDVFGRSALMFSAANASPGVFRLVMSQVSDREIVARDFNGRSLVHYAAGNQRHSIVPYIVGNNRCKLLDVENHAYEVVCNAIAEECVHVLDYAKDKFGDEWILNVKIRNSHPMLFAALIGKMRVLKWFVKKWPNLLETTKNEYGSNAFIHAAIGGHLNVLKWLTGVRGMDPTKQLYNLGCATMAAVEGCHKPVIEWLMTFDCPVKFARYDRDVVTTAVHHRHFGLVRWLFEKYQSKLPPIAKYSQMISSGAANAGDLDLMNWLYDEGCFLPNYAPRAAQAACEFDQVGIVSWLVDKFGAQAVYKHVDWRTPFEHAAEYHGAKIMKFWLAEGCVDADEKASQCRLAVINDDVEALKILKAHGVSLKSRDRIGETLLTFAAGGGHLGCVKWLLRQGLSLADKNDKGHTALQNAIHCGQHEVATFLQSLMYQSVT